MKHRLLSLVFTLLVLAPVGFSFIRPAMASAAGSEFAFNYDHINASVTAMSKAADKSEPIFSGDGRSDDPAFQSSQVIARGGFFGNGKIFSYAQLVKDYGYQYIDSYYCTNGAPQTQKPASKEKYYKVEISVIVDLDQNFFKHKNIPYEKAITRIDYNDGQPVNAVDQSWSASDAGYPLNQAFESSPAMPGSCAVEGFSVTDSPTRISPGIQVLEIASQATKDSWTATMKTISAGVIGTPLGSTTANGGSTTPPKLSCTIGSVTGLLNPLNWVLCPAISGMSDIIGFVDSSIVSQLSVGTDGKSDTPNQIFCNTGTCNAYYSAWSSFRNIALGLMVVAGLLVLISQALGMEILDAYTLRKTLPRLLIAAIAITLSWQLMSFFVQLTNDLGYGVRNLIYYPFTNALGGNINIDVSSWSANGASLLAGIGYLAIGAFGLLTLAASGALALLIAFFVLVLRQIAIIVLIITAPIAIMAYILPNTQNVYKLWWEAFSRALLMFPLIVAFLAAGHVFSLVAISNNNGHPGPLYQFAAFVSYFAPYFLIPATFKLAGGAIRQIGGFVNDRGNGAFGMLRNARNQSSQKRVKAFRTGGLYRDDFGQFGKKGRSIGKMLNTAGEWSLDFDEKSRLEAGLRGVPGTKRGAKKMVGDVLGAKIEQNRDAAQKAGPDYRLGWAIGSNFDRFAGSGGLDEANYHRLEETFGTGERSRDGSLIRNQEGKYTGGFRKVVGNDLEGLQSILSTGADGSDALFAARQLQTKKGTLMRLTDKDLDDNRRADLHSMGTIMSASEGRLEDPEMQSIPQTGSSVPAQYSQRLYEEAQRLTTQKRPEFAIGHGSRVRKNAAGELENYSVYDNDHFTLPETKKALMRLKTDEPQQGKAEFWDTTNNAWMHHAKEGEAPVLDPVTGKDTGKKTYSEDAKQLRSFIVQQGGYYSRNDPGAKVKIEKLKNELNITKDEEELYMRGFDPSDPRNRPDLPPPEESKK